MKVTRKFGGALREQAFQEACAKLAGATDGSGEPLAMHSLAVLHEGDYLEHFFPEHTGPSDIRSLSKTILALIAGAVSERSPDFDEEMSVWPYLDPNVWGSSFLEGEPTALSIDPTSVRRWENVTVSDLLSHRTGFDEVLLMRGDIVGKDPRELLDHVLTTPLVHEPGEHYLYSNAGSYLLSVVLERFLQEHFGVGLEGFAEEHFFGPLGIEEWDWEKYGDYLAGATRLWVSPKDLTQVGRMLLDSADEESARAGEVWEWPVGREWIAMLRTPTTPTPHVDTETNPNFRRHAYASGMWVGEKDNIFFGHGTGGQTLAIIPKKGAVVVTLADQGDVTRLEELVEETIQALDG